MAESKTSDAIDNETQELIDHLHIRAVQNRISKYCLMACVLFLVLTLIAIFYLEFTFMWVFLSLSSMYYWMWCLICWDASTGFRYNSKQRTEETPISGDE